MAVLQLTMEQIVLTAEVNQGMNKAAAPERSNSCLICLFPVHEGLGKVLKKLSIVLPSELHLRAKRQALLNDQSLNNLIISLLSNNLDSVDSADQ